MLLLHQAKFSENCKWLKCFRSSMFVVLWQQKRLRHNAKLHKKGQTCTAACGLIISACSSWPKIKYCLLSCPCVSNSCPIFHGFLTEAPFQLQNIKHFCKIFPYFSSRCTSSLYWQVPTPPPPLSLTDQPSNQCFIAVKWFNHRPLSCKFFKLAFLCLFFSHVNRLFCFMEIWYPPWQSLKNTYRALSAPCHWQITRYQTLTRYIWGYFSYFTTSLCNDRRQFFLLIIIMLIQFVGLFFANKMLTTSLGQVVGKKITTSLYSSVADPVLQIRGVLGGGGGGAARPGDKGGGGGKKIFFGLKIRGALPWICHCS